MRLLALHAHHSAPLITFDHEGSLTLDFEWFHEDEVGNGF